MKKRGRRRNEKIILTIHQLDFISSPKILSLSPLDLLSSFCLLLTSRRSQLSTSRRSQLCELVYNVTGADYPTTYQILIMRLCHPLHYSTFFRRYVAVCFCLIQTHCLRALSIFCCLFVVPVKLRYCYFAFPEFQISCGCFEGALFIFCWTVMVIMNVVFHCRFNRC